MADGSGSYSCQRLCDLVHSERATVLATFGNDFYAGMPALTENRFGEGRALFLASDADDRMLDDLYARLLANHGIAPALEAPAGVELTVRQNAEHDLLFILNHNATPASITLPTDYHDLLSDQTASGTIELEGYGVRILERAAE